MAFRLHRGEDAGRGLLRCILEQLDAAARALLMADGEPSDVVVHKTRRRLKKCRAVLRMLRKGKAGDDARACNRLLRDAGRALSRTRDARVALATLRGLSRRGGAAPCALAPLRRVLAANAAAHETAETPSRNAVELIRAAEAKLRGFPGSDFDDRELGDGLAWLYRRARKAARASHTDGRAARLHEWRKRSKDLLHALRLARKRCNPSAERMTRRLRHLGKVMGLRLDLEVLMRVAAACADPVPRVLPEMVEAERHRLDRRVEKAAHGLFEPSPKRFRGELIRE